VDGEPPRSSSYQDGSGLTVVVDEEGCIQIILIPPQGGPDGEPTVEIEAGPPLFDVRIVDNLIEEMGASGISVARFFDMESSPDFITVVGLLVANNRIRACMRLEVGDLPSGLRDAIGFGGVALADVEHFVLRDNAIQGNGVASLGPISGVFVLHGEGVAIDRNSVLNNGKVDSEDEPLRPGRRGGVVLAFARASVGPELAPLTDLGLEAFTGARQSGFPAAHIHDNIVVSPAGRALEIIALGPVSVEGNELTAKGSIFRNQTPLTPTVGGAGSSSFRSASLVSAVAYPSIASPSNPLLAFLDLLGGSTVSILNLGFSNEVYLQLLGLSGLFLTDDLPTQEAVEGTDDPRLFIGGNILFNDNQVVFDAFAPGVTFTLSSVLLISLDDISMEGNQCDCDLAVDISLLNALVMGWSIRVADNRFKEGIFNTIYSGLTIARMNHTTDNQSTHCLYPIGLDSVSTRSGNKALIEASSENDCAPFGTKLHEAYSGQVGFDPGGIGSAGGTGAVGGTGPVG
jgi:hypothetical protein